MSMISKEQNHVSEYIGDFRCYFYVSRWYWCYWGSFAGFLVLHGLELSTALVVAVIVRFFTLWYAVVVGFIALRLSRGLNVNTN